MSPWGRNEAFRPIGKPAPPRPADARVHDVCEHLLGRHRSAPCAATGSRRGARRPSSVFSPGSSMRSKRIFFGILLSGGVLASSVVCQSRGARSGRRRSSRSARSGRPVDIVASGPSRRCRRSRSSTGRGRSSSPPPRGRRGRSSGGSAAACARAPAGRPRGPRRSAAASSSSSGPTYSPLTEAIGAMSQAPRHSNEPTWTSSWPSAASTIASKNSSAPSSEHEMFVHTNTSWRRLRARSRTCRRSVATEVR